MAKKKSAASIPSVTVDRVARLVRLLNLLGAAPLARTAVTKRLRLNIRGFYRDLETLRELGVHIEHVSGKYHLRSDLAHALDQLPFPDPSLTVGEAKIVAKGKSPGHRKIQNLIDQIESH